MATGSSAGLNRVIANILTVNAAASAVPSPLSAYGTLNINDSKQVLTEAQCFKKWTFSLIGGGTGYEISIYGTNDPNAIPAWRASFNPQAPSVTVPASSWFLLPGPSEQSGTGAISNPMTSTTPVFEYNGSILACRAVLTATNSPTGSVTVSVLAVP